MLLLNFAQIYIKNSTFMTITFTGLIPIFLALSGAMFLWILVVYQSLAARKKAVQNLQDALKNTIETNQKTQLTTALQIALRQYNNSVSTPAAKFTALLFGFKPL